MNAAETIQAAIDKLEAQKDTYYAEGEEVWRVEHRDGFASRVFNQDDFLVADEVASIDADLIVTLHRTIDAQLAILRTAQGMLRPGVGVTVVNDAQDLARAILGEVS